ncbi:hypothetical protein OKW41_001051 [Paraburkholderia sp. UCT70]
MAESWSRPSLAEPYSLPIREFPAHYAHPRSASHAMPHSFKPTAEQHAVVDGVLGGGDLKVKAYAGAGKTSTLRLVADHLAGNRGSYLAFNKEIAGHARRGFPPNVSARTVHSLAYASVAPALTARLNLPAEPPHELAARYGLGLNWLRVSVHCERKSYDDRW